jgi:transcription elongation factor
MKLRRNFSQRSRLTQSIGPKTHVVGTGAINAQVRETKSRLIFSQRTHPIHSFGPKTHILGRFGLFDYGTKVDAKLAKLAPLTPKFAK